MVKLLLLRLEFPETGGTVHAVQTWPGDTPCTGSAVRFEVPPPRAAAGPRLFTQYVQSVTIDMVMKEVQIRIHPVRLDGVDMHEAAAFMVSRGWTISQIEEPERGPPQAPHPPQAARQPRRVAGR